MSALHGLSGIRPEMLATAGTQKRARKKRLTSPERWEVTQLIKSGVLSVEEYPDFDDENGQVHISAHPPTLPSLPSPPP